MKNSLSKILVRCIILLSTIVFMIFIIINANKELIPSQKYIVSDYKNVFLKSGIADVVIVGNSKALCSLSSSYFQQKINLVAYNFAYEAANLEFIKSTLETYFNNCKVKPRYCFLEVSWFSFNVNRTVFPDDIPINLKLKNYRQIFSPNKPYTLAFKFAESLRMLFYRILGRQAAFKEHEGDSDRKFIPFSKIEMGKSFPNYSAGIDKQYLKDFYDIIDLCNNNNVKLMLYTSPEAPEYTYSQKDRLLVRQEITGAAQKNKLDYLDFTVEGKYWDRSLYSNLADSHHVNNSRRFTEYFLQTLRSNNII
ncbi:MAG: hypothetical protein JZU65_20055 [Chlorobium sp.]|nr:hypothetical protein [Chlorobium sp.]